MFGIDRGRTTGEESEEAMVTIPPPPKAASQQEIVRRLVQEKGLKPGRYGFFFVTGEGKNLPGDEAGEALEEISGFVIDSVGRVFAFAVGWDAEQNRIGLTEWEPVEPKKHISSRRPLPRWASWSSGFSR